MIKDKIIEMIKSELMIDDLDLNADLRKDYEIDSIGLIESIMTLEDEFNIEIEDKELENLHSTNDVINLVQSKVEE